MEPLIDTYKLYTLEKNATQLKKSIVDDKQELEMLKYERDRIMESIAIKEAQLRKKQHHLESLQTIVTVEATALADVSVTTFCTAKYVESQLKYSA